MVLTQTTQAFRAERGLLGREAWTSAGELERNLGQGPGSLELGDVTVSPPAVWQTSGSCDPGFICSVGMAPQPQGPWLLGENVGRVRVSGAPRVQSARSRGQVTASGRERCVWQHQCCPRCGRRRRRPAHTPALWSLSRRRGSRCSERHQSQGASLPRCKGHNLPHQEQSLGLSPRRASPAPWPAVFCPLQEATPRECSRSMGSRPSGNSLSSRGQDMLKALVSSKRTQGREGSREAEAGPALGAGLPGR